MCFNFRFGRPLRNFSCYFFQMTTEAVEQPQQAEEKKPEVEVEAVG